MIGSLPLNTLYGGLNNGGLSVPSDEVHIEKVMPGSPAETAGILPGDIIVKAGGIEIHENDSLNGITNSNRGNNIDIEILRNGEFKTVQLTPRLENPPGEGATGIVISNYKFQKTSALETIYKATIGNISWEWYSSAGSKIAGPIGIIMEPEYFHLPIFIESMVLIILSVGIIMLKKWSIYLAYALTALGFIQLGLAVPHSNFNFNAWIGLLLCFVLTVIWVYYLYSQRKHFT